MDKMKELFEKMVNITYQARAQGEIGMVTGDRIDKVVKEYEEYCNREEREKLVLEAKDILDEVHKDLSTKNLETVNNLIDIGDKINKFEGPAIKDADRIIKDYGGMEKLLKYSGADLYKKG
ncbi:hypothetical protein DFR79_106124 [Halanaerobium saccharolyticum]|uniref:Uncharacterized protein n=1 Tax=Halanaerobium saccharolyticum TaxID=43595 RepID=A0A4R6LUF2_9FIRM|nr:hypothetical protein [Halanaerobium saccharolyticum]TDO92311.1 hypothetical protein DFR79_106124 [Halanaerobium saccharolyticum]